MGFLVVQQSEQVPQLSVLSSWTGQVMASLAVLWIVLADKLSLGNVENLIAKRLKPRTLRACRKASPTGLPGWCLE
jgi:hypothetical protein